MLSYNVGRQAAERQHFSTRNLKKGAVGQMGSSCETFQQRAIHIFLPRSFLPVSRTVEDITTHLWPPQNTREGGGGRDALRAACTGPARDTRKMLTTHLPAARTTMPGIL